MKTVTQILILGMGIVLLVGIVYGSYFVTKRLSYSFFYEDMVKATIIETVKPEYVK